VVEDIRLIGDVKGKDVILVDDIIDTAGTITKAAKVIMDEGANTVRAFCTHPVLSGPAYERLQESPFTEVVVTDTLSIKDDCDKITVLSSADLIAEVIHRVQNYKSISSLFNLSKKK
jgi:ribose-phosphate pyrophosphokinase